MLYVYAIWKKKNQPPKKPPKTQKQNAERKRLKNSRNK